ncbi:MAG: outer membrane lipid asymmetry maintenance protein MlaD [Magnetococcus sp. WYHC-3]
MHKRINLELTVGAFMIIGILCLVYLSITIARVAIWDIRGYEVFATFSDIGGLKSGSTVMIAGVDAGRVESVTLDDYEARVVLQISAGLQLHEDAIASVKTSGLIGEKFIQISIGSADAIIKPGGRIRQTESAVDLGALISKYAFGGI